MCIWYKCSILLMIFIFWSIHGYYIRKEKNLCFSGVCQPNQKLFIDYLPVWGNSNLIFSQCPWCISSYGCWLLWALWIGKISKFIFVLCFKYHLEKRKKGSFLSHLFPKNEVFHSPLPTSPDSGNETYFVVLFESNSIRKDYLPVNLNLLVLFWKGGRFVTLKKIRSIIWTWFF